MKNNQTKKEQFEDCFMWSPKDKCWKLLPRRTPDKIWSWIQQYRDEEVEKVLDRVKKEVIGEDIRHATNTQGEKIVELGCGNVGIEEAMCELQKDIDSQNFLKQQLRQKLSSLTPTKLKIKGDL